MEKRIVAFQNLSKEELYWILQLRSEVFVVEQNCIYQELDGKDDLAHHLMFFENQELVAYARLFSRGIVYPEMASIGRVVVRKNYRNNKIGKKLMQEAILALKEEESPIQIAISAQSHLKKFYASLGFHSVGKEYLEDDIPHIRMIYSKLI